MIKKIIIIVLLTQLNAEAQSSALAVGDSLYSNGNYSKAIESYKKYEDKAEVYDKIAKAYVAIGNFGEAVANYQKSVTSNSKNALVKFEYAKLLLRLKEFKEASKLFEELIYIDYKNPNYHYQQGVALEKLKDSTALNRFLSAYQLDETHQKAISKIAKYHLIKRNHRISHKYIDKGLESYNDNIELISLKAQNYFYQDYYKEAIIWFKKLLDLGEESEFIHEKLSICYADFSDYEDAIFHRKAVLKYNPKDAESLYLIGSYYERLGDFEEAQRYMEDSIKLQDVSLNKEYRQLGTVLNRQKKYEEAIKVFQKAIKEDPSDVFTRFLILRTKDEYYADKDAVIKLYEDFLNTYKNESISKFAEYRLKELKEKQFLDRD